MRWRKLVVLAVLADFPDFSRKKIDKNQIFDYTCCIPLVVQI